ncbi:hypothetical protein ACFYUV_04055 [Nonomuraea sp. NPDC003560]|uniref:hypothetical protein n=1 Tax=Nonomuraea sp. NPDC003560 TaxID=3364341 RepID=UPI0036A6D5F1
MPVFVTNGAIRLEWCDRCLSNSLAVADIYVMAGESIHQAGRLVMRCLNCDKA